MQTEPYSEQGGEQINYLSIGHTAYLVWLFRPDFLSQFHWESKVKLRGTTDHAKTKQEVILLMSLDS